MTFRGVHIIHPDDNVGVVLEEGFNAPKGHKLALRLIKAGETIVKYGFSIGIATLDIEEGAWVHTHNMRTLLDGFLEYSYMPASYPLMDNGRLPDTFIGYPRRDGRAGIRNEIWILPTVGCVSETAREVAARAGALYGHLVDGVYAFPHPYGCGQTGEDTKLMRKSLAALATHPNAGGALLLGLGCEGVRTQDVLPLCGGSPNVVAFNAQDVEDEVEHAIREIGIIARRISAKRVPIPIEKLVIGLKCGGSDGYSGLTANPLLGRVAERVAASGASAVMSEVPEMFGAETILMSHAKDEEVYGGIVGLINEFKAYYIASGQPIYENPSPGNRDGGITTLEEKSLGCTQKAGRAPVCGVIGYAEPIAASGLNLVWGPGYDLCACTALAMAGAQITLFTTGRGTPYGGPNPTIKVSTNAELAARKRNWIDFDASPVLQGGTGRLADELIALIMDTANGKPTQAEKNHYREIALLKTGVTV